MPLGRRTPRTSVRCDQPGQRRTTNENRYVRSVSARPVAKSERRTDEQSDQPSAARRAGDRPRQARRRCQKTVTTTEKTRLLDPTPSSPSPRKMCHDRMLQGPGPNRSSSGASGPAQSDIGERPNEPGADRVSARQRANAALTCRYEILGHQRRPPLWLLGGRHLRSLIVRPVRRQLFELTRRRRERRVAMGASDLHNGFLTRQTVDTAARAWTSTAVAAPTAIPRAISASIRLSARRFENQKFPHGSFSTAAAIIAETRTGLRLIRMRRSRMRVSSVSFEPGIHRPLWAALRLPPCGCSTMGSVSPRASSAGSKCLRKP